MGQSCFLKASLPWFFSPVALALSSSDTAIVCLWARRLSRYGILLEEGQRLTGMGRWLKGWTKSNESGRSRIQAARGVLGEGKGSQGSIQQGSARFASCTRRISSTYRGKLAVETRRHADCKYLLQGSIGTDPRRSKHFHNNLRTGIPRDDANPAHYPQPMLALSCLVGAWSATVHT